MRVNFDCKIYFNVCGRLFNFQCWRLKFILMYPIPALRFGGCAAFGRRPARAPAAPRDSSLRFSVSRSLSSCPRCQNRTVFRRSILYILFFLLQFLSKGKWVHRTPSLSTSPPHTPLCLSTEHKWFGFEVAIFKRCSHGPPSPAPIERAPRVLRARALHGPPGLGPTSIGMKNCLHIPRQSRWISEK